MRKRIKKDTDGGGGKEGNRIREGKKKPMRKTAKEKKSEAWQSRIPDISRAPRKRINDGRLNILTNERTDRRTLPAAVAVAGWYR